MSYRVSEHGAAFTAEQAAAMRGTPIGAAAKALVMRAKGHGFVLLVLPADRQLASARLRRGLGASRLRFATGEELLRLTGLRPGCVPPFGAPIFELPLFIDQSFATRRDEMVFTAGRHDRSLTMAVVDYLAVAGGQLLPLTKDQ